MKRYDQNFKDEALKLSDDIGIKKGLEELKSANEILKDALVFFAVDRKK